MDMSNFVQESKEFSKYIFLGLFFGFIDRLAEDMTGNGLR